MMQYSIEPIARKNIKGYGFFLSYARKYKKQLLNTGLDASKKVSHKRSQYLGNKIADAVTKLSDDSIKKQEPVEELIVLPEKRDEIMDKLRKLL